MAIRKSPARADHLQFGVMFLMGPHDTRLIDFKAVCGPGDNGEPVLTIMLPHED